MPNPILQPPDNGPPTKRKVVINVYDLLQPGKLSSFLCYIGVPPVHTGVEIDGKEFTFGYDDRVGQTGVYCIPSSEFLGGAPLKCQIFQGFAYCSSARLKEIIEEASQKFMGVDYDILRNNCNHFTSWLCYKLTGERSPAWINRASKVGRICECLVPPPAVIASMIETAGQDTVNANQSIREENTTSLYEKIKEQIRYLTERLRQIRLFGNRPSSTENKHRVRANSLQTAPVFSESRSLMTEFKVSSTSDSLSPISLESLASTHYPRFDSIA